MNSSSATSGGSRTRDVLADFLYLGKVGEMVYLVFCFFSLIFLTVGAFVAPQV